MERMAKRPNALGALLRERRRASQKGFKELHAATGCEPETLRRWETGDTYDVPLRGVLRYARVVGISLEEIQAAALDRELAVDEAIAEADQAIREAGVPPDDALPEDAPEHGEDEAPPRQSG